MMNERIKELAIKSGFKKYKNDDGLYSPYIEGYDIDDELEEFAKSIIQECAKVADDNFNKGFCPVGDYIKQHFGVE